MFLPRATNNLLFSLFAGTDSKISRKPTGVMVSLANSIPTVDLPGIGA